MSRTYRPYILVGFLALFAAVPALAFHGGGGGGGHGGGGGGGFRGGGGGFQGGRAAPAFNRTPSFSQPRAMPQQARPAAGNFDRSNSINSVNRANTFNNVNRSTVNNVNRTGTVNNVNRVGNGWNNPYMGYHSGWAHGYWNGHNPGGFGGGYGYGMGGYGMGGGLGFGMGMGLGMGMGFGLSSWMMGPMLYNSGYSNYSNPYYGGGNALVAQQPMVYDYAQPIDPQLAPPDETVANQANTTFEAARVAFKAGDYPKALALDDQALKTTPNDPTLHEFRAQTLFALQRYDEAATALYAVLTVGPGWDWTTLISLYGDPEAYTQQLRALEAYCTQNTKSAAANFVLAYQYLTEEHPEAAVRQLKIVTALQPKDTLSAQLLQQLEQSQKPDAGAQVAGTQASENAPAAVSATTPTGKEGKLDGSWMAQPDKDVKITLAFQPDGNFAWSVGRQGKKQQFAGKSSYENGILTMVQDKNNNTMVGNVSWTDENHFTFKIMGGAPNDPGLSFAKAS